MMVMPLGISGCSDVTAGNSEESSGLANQFNEFEIRLEDATGARVHLSGDLILVHNVLSGLVISQVRVHCFQPSSFPIRISGPDPKVWPFYGGNPACWVSRNLGRWSNGCFGN